VKRRYQRSRALESFRCSQELLFQWIDLAEPLDDHIESFWVGILVGVILEPPWNPSVHPFYKRWSVTCSSYARSLSSYDYIYSTRHSYPPMRPIVVNILIFDSCSPLCNVYRILHCIWPSNTSHLSPAKSPPSTFSEYLLFPKFSLIKCVYSNLLLLIEELLHTQLFRFISINVRLNSVYPRKPVPYFVLNVYWLPISMLSSCYQCLSQLYCNSLDSLDHAC